MQPGEKWSDRIKTLCAVWRSGSEIHAFAAATVDLQEKRFIADYDVMAREPIHRAPFNCQCPVQRWLGFNRADEEQREAS